MRESRDVLRLWVIHHWKSSFYCFTLTVNVRCECGVRITLFLTLFSSCNMKYNWLWPFTLSINESSWQRYFKMAAVYCIRLSRLDTLIVNRRILAYSILSEWLEGLSVEILQVATSAHQSRLLRLKILSLIMSCKRRTDRTHWSINWPFAETQHICWMSAFVGSWDRFKVRNVNKVLLENYKKLALYDNKRSKTVAKGNLVILQGRKKKFNVRMCLLRKHQDSRIEAYPREYKRDGCNISSYLDEANVDGSLAEALPTHIEVIFTNDGRGIRCDT